MHDQRVLRSVIGSNVVVLLLLCSAPAWGADASRTLLLVDDEHVLYRPGTERAVQPFHRHPTNPLIKPDKPWDGEIAWTSVYRDPKTGRYQLWYQAYTGNTARQKTHRCVVCYAESQDGIHFTKPDPGLFSFNDHKATNIVLLANGGRSDRYSNSVVVDEFSYRVRGFSREETVPIKGNSLRHEVAWKERRLVDLPAGRFHLRLHLDNATVYAVTLAGRLSSTTQVLPSGG